MPIDQEWYLPILVWVVPAGFLAALIFTLWTGKLYARGPICFRDKQPDAYWSGVAFLVVCLAITVYMAVSTHHP